jgi:hypothetical protein
MAGNRPVPQGLEVKLVWAWNGNPSAINIFHFAHELGAVHTQARADAIATAIRSAYTTAGQLGSFNHTGVTLARIESRHMDAATDPWFIGAGAAVAGTSAANPLPAATSFVVSLRTGLRGRSFNGRVYLWGWTEDANDAAGGIAAAAAEAGRTFVGNVGGGVLSAAQSTFSVLSRFTTPAGSPPGTVATERVPPLLTPVTAAVTADLRWDVQRRRAVPGI